MVFSAGSRLSKGVFRAGRDTARTYRQKGFSAAAGAAAGGVGGAALGALSESAKDLMKPSGKFWSILSKNKSVLGINLGIGSLLKQSQVFTSGISSVLQIIGALVDVFIAPFFIPLILPLIKKMSSFIPIVREKAQELADKWVPYIKDKFTRIWQGDDTWFTKITKSVGALVGTIMEITGIDKVWKDFKDKFGTIRDGVNKAIGVIEIFTGKHDRASKLEALAKQGGNLGPATSPTAFGGVDVSMFGTGTGDRARAGYSYDRAVADANKNISMYANMAMFNTYIQSSPNDVLIEAGQIGGGTSTNKESDEKYNPINTLYLGE
jgi:hypothetical protein|tara:strand:- start:3494 stop:4459 length:966 start_codon:yes stop_codon:yes gene_type:complete